MNESGKVRGSGFIWKELVIVWIGMEMVKFGYVVKKGVMGFVDWFGWEEFEDKGRERWFIGSLKGLFI